MDRIHIKDLALQCIIGTEPHERQRKQEVRIDVSLECDLSAAGRSDRLADTLDYKTLKEEIMTCVENSSFFLIEKLAETVAEICLRDRRVEVVQVAVDKPGALTRARSVAVEIRRARSAVR